MKILIYGGSFDPVHKGHHALLSAACRQIKPDYTHIFTAFQSPFKDRPATPFEIRQKMAEQALGQIYPNIIFDDFEFKQNRVVYTCEAVKYLRGLYPKAELYLLVGTDCLNTLHLWKNADYLFKNTIIAAGRRKGFNFETKAFKFKLLDGIFPLISSTQIRLAVLCNGLLPNSLLPQTASFIEKNRMYGLNLHRWLQDNLKPNRYLHVKLVAQQAVILARYYNLNTDKAALAGILHDCAKSMPSAKLIKYAKAKKLKIKDFTAICKNSPSLLHAPVSADMAKKLFGVKDKEILQAIDCHTLGRAEMSALDKVLFTADMASKDRRPKEAQKVRAAALKSLDAGVLAALAVKLIFTVDRAEWLAPQGLNLWNELVLKK